ncbi:hypothetical protein JT358_00375 [Micrococcales bacterium 31B]|nr:hypothetical protein [Micrococcales bacterium 31B]
MNWRKATNLATSDDLGYTPLLERTVVKVGTTLRMEPTPGYVVTATATALGGQNAPGSLGITSCGGTSDVLTNVVTQNPANIGGPSTLWQSNLWTGGYASNDNASFFTGNTQLPSPGNLVPFNGAGNLSATLSFSATLNGEPAPVDLVVTDGESLSARESMVITTNGTAWEPIDNADNAAGTRPMWTSTVNAGFGSQNFGAFITIAGLGDPGEHLRVPLAVSKNVTTVNVNLKSGWTQDVYAQIALLYSADAGSAPASYGTAWAQQKYQPKVGTNAMQSDLAAADYPALVNTNPHCLGTVRPDVEPSFWPRFWGSDSVPSEQFRKVNDESVADLVDGGKFPQVRTCSTNYTFTLNATAADGVPVAGWIDFNMSGAFDPGERLQSTVQGGKVNFSFAGQKLPAGTTGIGSRFWLSSDVNAIQQPTGTPVDGSVQDHLIPVQIECTTATGTGQQGSPATVQGADAFPGGDLTGASYSLGANPDGTPLLAAPALDASGAEVGAYTVDPATGVLTFIPTNPNYIGSLSR